MAKPRDTKRTPGSGRTEPEMTDLAARIARARGEHPGSAPTDGVRRWELTAVGRGYRLAAEFVAAIVVGAGLGWGMDQLLGTRPWGMIVLLLFGFAAGVRNMIRATAEMNADRAKQQAPPGVSDDDERD